MINSDKPDSRFHGNDTRRRAIFFGTSDFAVPSLRSLSDDPRFDVVAVVTQPDRPVGRHATITPPPVKIAATERNGEIFQPEKLMELKDRLPAADVFVVVSYGKILPQWLIELSSHGIVNVHGSLLPRWRGASPIQAAIAAGDEMTGVTIMQIDAELDHGPILATAEEPIRPDDTGGSLHDRLAELGAKILPDTLAGFLDGTITPQDQEHDLATFCRTLKREGGKLDTSRSAVESERKIRAYSPWPGTYIETEGKRLKILTARVAKDDASKSPGTLFIRNALPCLACADGTVLELTMVQPEGKKQMSGMDFTRGSSNVTP